MKLTMADSGVWGTKSALCNNKWWWIQ